MKAVAILQDAAGLVSGPRQADYGPPEVNFARIARLWSPVLGIAVEPWQVALCLAQLKVARLIQSPDHADSAIDMAAYAALAGQLAIKEGEGE